MQPWLFMHRAGRNIPRGMWGLALATVDDGVSEHEAEMQLTEVLRTMPPDSRRFLLHGLLRPEKILVDGYSAPQGRCCPLTAAVWESTGHRVTAWKEIVAGIHDLGLGSHHSAFYQAFDRWARACHFRKLDRDGSAVLSRDGRGQLVRLVEREMSRSRLSASRG
jgi:hypothetical protein